MRFYFPKKKRKFRITGFHVYGLRMSKTVWRGLFCGCRESRMPDRSGCRIHGPYTDALEKS